jgi:murein L,D-transpeptidase YafK
MFACNLKRLLNSPRCRTANIVSMALLAVVLCSASASGGEPLYPVALMNWMVEGTFHAVIVDKAQQRLSVWRIKDGEPSMVESYRCSTGENDGDKWVRGDMKTPEGVYFFCSVIDGRTLPAKYGMWAFTTDYPNFVDRRRGKNGDGIWLHGRDKPLGSKPDSNGCVALENQDLIKVSRFVRLQSTPIIVVEKLLMAPRSVIMEQERELRNFIESWRQAWESKNLDDYMSYYSPNFQSSWLDFNGWKEKKRRLNKRYSSIRVKLGNVYLYRQNGLITSIFTQSYGSQGFNSSGIKVLYITHHDKLSIYAEDYHQPVDDPFPVQTLLAKVGADFGTGTSDGNGTGTATGTAGAEPNDFRIRLVSTDEPEPTPQGEVEAPRPSAPSRGVVLDRVSEQTAKETAAPHIEMNEKYLGGPSSDRLIVARLMPTYVPLPSIEAAVRKEKPEAEVDLEAQNPPIVEQSPKDEVATKKDKTATQVAARPEKHDKIASGPKEKKTAQIPAAPPHARMKSEMRYLSASLEKMTRYARAETKDPAGRDIREGQPHGSGSKAVGSAGKVSDKAASDKKAILAFLGEWKLAWEQKNLDRFIKMYHPDFEHEGMNYSTLLKTKKNFFRKYRTIRVEVDRVEIRKVQGRVLVRFVQSFQGDNYSDKGWKSMVLAGGKDTGFRIVSEGWTAISGSSSDTHS